MKQAFLICFIWAFASSAQENENDTSTTLSREIAEYSGTATDISENSLDAQIESSNTSEDTEHSIAQAQKDVIAIINREFEFEDLPEYITAQAKKEFFISVGMELIEYLVTVFPQSARYEASIKLLGDYYYNKKNYQKALYYLEQWCARAEGEELSLATYKLGYVYQELGEHEKAIKTFLRVIDFVGESDEMVYTTYIEIGRSYHILNNIKKEIVTYENASNFFVDKAKSAYFDLLIAKTHFEQQNYFDAQWNLEKIVREYPDSRFIYEALYILAQTYNKTDDLDKQRKVLLDIINRRTTDNNYITRALSDLGDSYYKKNEYKDAVIAYYTALKQDTGELDAAHIVSRLAHSYVKLGLYDLALEAFQELLGKGIDTKKKTEVFFEIAKINFEQQRYDDSLKALENVLLNQSILDEKRTDTFYLQAMNFFYLKKYRESFETFLQIKHQASNQVIAVKSIFMLGAILEKIEKFYSAARYYNEVLNKYNSLVNPEAGDSEENGQRAVFSEYDKNELMKVRTDTLFALANGYFERENYEKSVEYYIQLSELELAVSDKAWAFYRTGKCFENRGEYDKAKEMFKRVETGFPDIEIARQASWDSKNVEWRQTMPHLSKEKNTQQ